MSDTSKPIAWYTDFTGKRIYAAEPHEIHEPGMTLTFSEDNPATDYWFPLYGGEDSARLDSLNDSEITSRLHGMFGTWYVRKGHGFSHYKCKSVREAIDRAVDFYKASAVSYGSNSTRPTAETP